MEVLMTKPTEQQRKLVAAVADALADYHGERRGNWGCHAQAAMIVIAEFHLSNLAALDFFEEVVTSPA
jgi:phenylpyruvate tautomerase PptA (4-oxalocrotonate tautomerase family)